MNWQAFFAVLAILLLAFIGFRYVRANPESLSRENLSKSFSTLGFLALGLIALIAVLIMMLR